MENGREETVRLLQTPEQENDALRCVIARHQAEKSAAEAEILVLQTTLDRDRATQQSEVEEQATSAAEL